MELCNFRKVRKVFLQNILQRRREGQLSLMSGPVVDRILVQELESPHTDMRCGVNIICRPTIEVVEYIVSIQQYLNVFEPDQHYYPPSDLHLTLVEICHSRTPEDAFLIAGAVGSEIRRIAAMTSAPKVDSPMLVFDSHAIALNFLPTDDALQNVRQSVVEGLANIGISIDSRRETKSAARHPAVNQGISVVGFEGKDRGLCTEPAISRTSLFFLPYSSCCSGFTIYIRSFRGILR